MTDTRLAGLSDAPKGGVIWKVDQAHQGSIHSVQFNPFIPYWLASAGEDGVAKVWDLRFLKYPVARVDGHFGSIHSVSKVKKNVMSSWLGPIRDAMYSLLYPLIERGDHGCFLLMRKCREIFPLIPFL